MPADHHPQHTSDQHTLGESLAPALVEACRGKLGPIEWFRSVWQRGGAATGFATWSDPAFGPEPRDAMVKIPVGPAEHGWTVLLGGVETERFDDNDTCRLPTPRVLACGESIAGYDLAWLVIERLPGKPLNTRPDSDAFERLLHAAARFQRDATNARPIGPTPPPPDWATHIAKAREHLRDGVITESQKWNEALKRVQKLLPRLLERWNARPINAWCHGDLHLGNAMLRPAPTPDQPPTCVLIDLALVHPGHWVEDALYLERQFWGHEQALCGIKPVATLARARRELGIDNGEDHATIANIRRVLAAACVPLLLDREGNARYVHGALEVLDRVLPQLARC
ncbi:MAG: aminoglycoside phosphotransferase family protein [Phycisphaeraceae bacterium]|nr:MAG: aminoglycoside phosphotransferase family protein [Phycisphaeraceae bacterium]